MGILIDSDLLIHLERRSSDLERYIEGREDEEFFLSVISASELLHGVYRAEAPKVRNRRLALVEAVLESFPLIEIDLAIARSHARLWSDLRKQGTMIGVHDSWLAATCLAYDLTLVTRNLREFQRVPGMRAEAWDWK